MGATIHLHYCMGKLISWGLIDHDSKRCETCGMKKGSTDQEGYSANKNCCKDEHKEIKTDKDQKQASAEYQFFKFSPDAQAIQLAALPIFQLSSITIENPRANAPPLINERPIFLLNRNFRI
jgi:hypothetical protein